MVVLRSPAALAAAVLASLLCGLLAGPALAAPGPTVTVRIEGETQTLLPRTQVQTSTDPVAMSGGGTCPGTSVAGAIEKATNGNWDRQSFTSTILGETHTFTHNDYWAEWLDNKYGNGICNDTVAEGDEVAMLVDLSDPSTFAPTVFPVALQGVPAVVGRGESFTVTVIEYKTDAAGTPGTGTPTPVAGATVSGGGATATTDAQGHATLSLGQTGAMTLQAVKSANARSATEPVCVHDGDDGKCGTALAAGGPLPPKESRSPGSALLGLRQGQRFSGGQGPRLLKGHVDLGTGALEAVRLRLRRVTGGKCYFWSVKAEKWRRRSCDADGFFYTIGDRPDWSYLLPARLGPGRYDLHAKAVDASGLSQDAYVLFRVAGQG